MNRASFHEIKVTGLGSAEADAPIEQAKVVRPIFFRFDPIHFKPDFLPL